jgi:ADP-heptose:LPS heptosyltransferase
MRGRHFSDLMLDLARRLDVPTDGLKPDYFCRPEELDQARAKISTLFPDYQGEPILGIHPGCQSNTCNLPPRAYGEFASLALARTNWRIIVTGSAKELALLQSWPSEILASPRVYVSMGELDLRSLAAMISLMQNYVIGSTGPLHLAAALGVPTTSPFCPLPPISASVWGNASANGTCVQPNPECCRRWTASAPPHRHCDLRGEITAEHLWTSLEQRKSIQL